jgi:LacI family xylobiose transport system transcriptional regulator
VALETRRRVEAALREHGYRRPESVMRAAGVEVVFFGMQSNLAVEIMRGVEQVVSEHKLAVGFIDALHQASTGRSWARDLLVRRPTGVIAVHLGFTSEQHDLLAASAIPLVALDPTGEPEHSVPSVGATNWSGGIEATRHLLDLGHRRIAVITGPTERLCARARLAGARAALDAGGVPLDEQLVRTGRWFAFEDGLSHARELLRLPDPPTAVLCGNDLQALGVYEAARQAGLRIPHDLSVIGFDDISYTRWCGPPMTTIRQPVAEMGAAAAKLVLSLAAGQPLTQTRVELATTLIVRDSTAPPPERDTGGACQPNRFDRY